jgi:hypothetical protein
MRDKLERQNGELTQLSAYVYQELNQHQLKTSQMVSVINANDPQNSPQHTPMSVLSMENAYVSQPPSHPLHDSHPHRARIITDDITDTLVDGLQTGIPRNQSQSTDIQLRYAESNSHAVVTDTQHAVNLSQQVSEGKQTTADLTVQPRYRVGVSEGADATVLPEIRKRVQIAHREIAEIRRDLACKPDIGSIHGLFNLWKAWPSFMFNVILI